MPPILLCMPAMQTNRRESQENGTLGDELLNNPKTPDRIQKAEEFPEKQLLLYNQQIWQARRAVSANMPGRPVGTLRSDNGSRKSMLLENRLTGYVHAINAPEINISKHMQVPSEEHCRAG